ALALYQGGAMVNLRGAGAIAGRARRMLRVAGVVALVLFTAGGIWLTRLRGFAPGGIVDPSMPANPLASSAVAAKGLWLANFLHHPALFVVPLIVYVALIAGMLASGPRHQRFTWWCGAVAWMATIGSVGAALFPMLAPSYADIDQSLTIWNSSSSLLTLIWMLGFSVVFIPLIVFYTGWAFRVMGGKVSADDIRARDRAGRESY
ncbi:MAG TPA: cytochrome d ubiquinol oxidase subunit II, partial [Rhodanobacteraceae bacterium]